MTKINLQLTTDEAIAVSDSLAAYIETNKDCGVEEIVDVVKVKNVNDRLFNEIQRRGTVNNMIQKALIYCLEQVETSNIDVLDFTDNDMMDDDCKTSQVEIIEDLIKMFNS